MLYENYIDFLAPEKLYRGSVVTSGQCVMKVSKVGDSTVYGKLNCETEEVLRESPLTVKLRILAKGISKFGYVGAFLTSIIILFQKIHLLFVLLFQLNNLKTKTEPIKRFGFRLKRHYVLFCKITYL